MFKKFFYLYLVGGAIALGLLIYHVAINYKNLNFSNIGLDVLALVLFFYLAYKTYHEKKDQEMM